MSRVAAVILAAGKGTRFVSAQPKVLHPVAGLPMVLWTVRHARALGADPLVLVVGPEHAAVRQATSAFGLCYATQHERLGTAHAALQARDLLQGRAETLLLTYADMPALRPETLQRLLALHQERQPALTMLTAVADDPMGFGRVVRDSDGRVTAIVEEAVATPDVLALRELNCGVYCLDASWAWDALARIRPTPPKNEFYLTDLAEMAAADGLGVETLATDNVDEVQGVNTRVHLARCEQILRRRIAEAHMLAGVTIVDPASTYIDVEVRLGRDTVVHPNTHLQGHTKVGENCILGPNSVIRDSRLGARCRVVASMVEEAVLEDEAEIGPFGHLRPGAYLGHGVHMGNYGEVKNAHLGPGVKMGHFSYVGDADVGEGVNIGAGTITCNYDGRRKQRTVIEAGAFVGSGSMLVAPVRIGRGAVIGAGSVVTRDVPPGTVAYGVPARPRRSTREAADEDESR